MKEKIRNLWMNLSIEHRVLIALVGTIVGFVLVCMLIYGAISSISDWRFNNKIENSIEKTNEHKTNSNSLETNANALVPAIEESRTETNIAANNRIKAQQNSNSKRVEINEALKKYEKDKIRNNNRAISDAELSDESIRQRADRLGINADNDD